MAGIKETKEAIKFCIELVKSVETSLQDNVFSFEDVANFVNSIIAASEGLTGAKSIPTEIRDLQPEEVQELHDFIKSELVLENQKYEKFLEDAVEIVVKIYDLVQLAKEPGLPD